MNTKDAKELDDAILNLKEVIIKICNKDSGGKYTLYLILTSNAILYAIAELSQSHLNAVEKINLSIRKDLEKGNNHDDNTEQNRNTK